MAIRILSFGQLAEITGSNLVLEAEDIRSLKDELIKRFPMLATKTYSIAVNKKLTTENIALTKNDTVALMPPYSGG